MSLNDWLFVALCLASIYSGSVAALLFCMLYGVHSIASPDMPDWARYVALILIDSATAFVILALKRPSRASVITGVFSGVFLVVNVSGFVLWYLYFPPATYDAVCSAVYLAMMAALFREGSDGHRRLALRSVGAAATGAPVRESMGVHHKDGGQA